MTVSFYLNGRRVTIADPAPDLLLIDYLRSPAVALAGPKKPCGQGGCGGCTVIVSRWDGQKPEHRAINSCLRPVCALGGLAITTIEGMGAVRRPNPRFLQHVLTASRAAAPVDARRPPAMVEAAEASRSKYQQVLDSALAAVASQARVPSLALVGSTAEHPSQVSHDGINPVAYRLALNNGSQCGYCSVGFVMNMSEFITNRPNATKKEIEDAFDGNLCRCTGYRSILTGMKTFASDWTDDDEANRMKCLLDAASASQKPSAVVIPFPDGARGPAEPVTARAEAQSWATPTTLTELAALLWEHRAKRCRLVHGNTSFGVYVQEFASTQLFIDIRLIPELNQSPVFDDRTLSVASGIRYSDLIDVLASTSEPGAAGESSRFAALLFMAQRTAGRIVRNAATLGGNTMMVLRHIAAGSGEPFPSDVFTTLVAIEARIDYLELVDARFVRRSATAGELVALAVGDPTLVDRVVLERYRLPMGPQNEVVLAQKVALREVNAHSIVNGTSVLSLSGNSRLESVVLTFGAIAPYPWRAVRTEAALTGKELGLAAATDAAPILEQEVREELAHWASRSQDLPSEGFTAEYRAQLAVSFLYKAVVNAMQARGQPVPSRVASSGVVTWGRWPVSDGRQSFVTQAYKAPVGQPYIKATAMYQTSGQIHYTQELPVPEQTANAAFVQSRRALAEYSFTTPGREGRATPEQLRAHLTRYAPSFIDLITAANIKDGGINYQGMGMDQPLFAESMVNYVGQSIALVLAQTEQEAVRIAEYVSNECVAYSPANWPPPWNEPLLGLDQAIAMNSVFPDAPKSASFNSHIWKITRPGSQLDWVRDKPPLDRDPVVRQGIVSGVTCTIVEHAQSAGGQAHFYMESQACVAEPIDERRFVIHPSSQSPMEMHGTTAMALGIHYNQIDVRVSPVGGGFGGKTEQARFVTGPAAWPRTPPSDRCASSCPVK